jgi:hypothetical protein
MYVHILKMLYLLLITQEFLKNVSKDNKINNIKSRY